MWTDITTSAVIKSDLDMTNDCNSTAVARYRQKLATATTAAAVALALTEQQQACVAVWSLTHDLNCPLSAEKEEKEKKEYIADRGDE